MMGAAHGRTREALEAADAAARFRNAAERAQFVAGAVIEAGTDSAAIVEFERRTSAEAVQAGLDAVALLEKTRGVEHEDRGAAPAV